MKYRLLRGTVDRNKLIFTRIDVTIYYEQNRTYIYRVEQNHNIFFISSECILLLNRTRKIFLLGISAHSVLNINYIRSLRSRTALFRLFGTHLNVFIHNTFDRNYLYYISSISINLLI